MSLRPSRSVALTLSLLIVVMMIVGAPVMAVAHTGYSEAPAQPPGDPASSASQSAPSTEARANSNGATGQADPATMTPPTQHGNRTEAGQNNLGTPATPPPPPRSNAGGDPAASGGGTSSSGGNSRKATTTGGGSDVSESHQDKGTSGTPSGKGDGPSTGVGGNCDGDPSGGSSSGNGANTSGDFDDTCGTSPSGPAPNGNGAGGAKGKPCSGCVGNADDKNPPGQSHRPEDANAGYECDRNNGIGKGNPAHTGCPLVAPPPDCTVACNPPPPGCTVNCTRPPPGCTVDCVPPPPIVDCDGDGIDDNVDNDLKKCEPPLPGEDCDEDGVPDDVDTDLSDCEPTVRPDLCPDGSERPASGICDEVLGEIIERDPKPVFPGGPVVAGENLGAPEPEAQAAVLPFTGGHLLPFFIVSLALMGVGGTLLRRRVTATTESEAA